LIRILADKYIYRIEELIPEKFDLHLYDPITEVNPDLSGYEAFLVRTVQKINPDTYAALPESLKFIGTASSGRDHLDVNYIEDSGVQVFDSKGCNANAVAEYVITSILVWSEKKFEKLDELTVGIVGFGFIGSKVGEKLDKLGIAYRAHDPYRAEWDADFKSTSIDEVLNCDILTIHIPLTTDEGVSNYHWMDYSKMNHSPFRLIINASRGGIIEEEALIQLYDDGRILDFVKDVWENEPDFNPAVSSRAFISTPHIAGYSNEAKLNATRIILDKMCSFFGMCTSEAFPQPEIADFSYLDSESLVEILNSVNPILIYDRELKALPADADRREAFARLRTGRPYRTEYHHTKLSPKVLERYPRLKMLDFLAGS
jgi:erythronate-4-phosphate dehydrogenase